MGVASLVLGIISLIIGWIPFVCFFVFVLAVIGLILGIIDTVKKNKTEDSKRGISIAGLIICAISIPIIIVMSFVSIGIVGMAITDTNIELNTNYEDYNYDWYNEWYDTYYNNVLDDYNVL